MTLPSHPAFAEAMADLRVLGIEQSERGEPYGLVAARSNARWWLLPLCSGQQARAGLELFHPVSFAARVAKSGASLACRLGLQRLAFGAGPRLSSADRFVSTFPQGAASSLTIFTGTEGPHRKTAIQFTDRGARILGYGKLSRSPQVIPWIETEAQVLQEVGELQLRTADVPRVLDLRRMDSGVLLITDSKKGSTSSMPRTLTRAHVAFLAELAARTEGSDWPSHVEAMRARLAAIKPVMGPEWQARIGAALDRLSVGPELPVVLAHGDFTPWNTFHGDRLYVFDWEYARRDSLGHDALHFTFADRLLQDAARLESTALKVLGSLHTELDARQSLLAYLCSNTLLFAQRECDGLRRIDGWADSTRLAPLIDRLLEARR